MGLQDVDFLLLQTGVAVLFTLQEEDRAARTRIDDRVVFRGELGVDVVDTYQVVADLSVELRTFESALVVQDVFVGADARRNTL